MAARQRVGMVRPVDLRLTVRRVPGFLLFLVFVGWTSAALAEKRIALVIGNGSYTTSRLKNPRSDAGLMAKSLASTGFDVLTVMDATAEDMRVAIAQFGSRLQTPGTVALFYYAGHGVQVDGENYLLPLGADFKSTEDVTEYGIPLQSVTRTMQRSGARLNIVVLDACRDNPFIAGSWIASVNGLASIVAPADTIIGYSTGPGQLAEDGSGNNSPYTAALASEMMQPGATLEDVFRATRRHVLERTGNHQTPWEHSSLVSQFYFVSAPVSATEVSPASTVLDARFAEMAAWNDVKESRDPALLQEHIKRFPNGLFAERAAVRISKIAAMTTLTPWSTIMAGDVDTAKRLVAAQAIYAKAIAIDVEGAPPADMVLAVRLYTEAAAEGLPSAMYRLGLSFDKGRGVSKDLLEAGHWFQRASNAGHPAAMAALGTMHEFGEGAAPNLAEALRLYRAAADAGNSSGMTSLGYLFSQGKGVARNFTEARRWYKVAVDQNDPRALFNLALMDISGDGGAVDTVLAVKHLQSAAALGHSGALVELARLYDRGRGVRRDPTLAAQYLLKAVQVGHRDRRVVEVTNLGLTFATRRQIQKQLAAQGLYAGSFHGFLNEETRQALGAVALR